LCEMDICDLERQCDGDRVNAGGICHLNVRRTRPGPSDSFDQLPPDYLASIETDGSLTGNSVVLGRNNAMLQRSKERHTTRPCRRARAVDNLAYLFSARG
jgi:hypothetical protein